MAAPAIGNTNGGNSGSQVASVVAALPAGAVSGDLIGYAQTVDSGVSAPSTGWTELFQTTTPSGFAALMIGYRRLDGGANDTLTLTHDGNKAYSYVTWKVTGAHASTNPETGGAASGTSAAPNSGSINPTGWDVEDTLWLSICGWDATPTLSSGPSGYTVVRTERNGSATFGSGVSVYWIDPANAASEDAGAFALSGSTPWAAGAMAFRPAPADITKSLTTVTESDAPVSLGYGRAVSLSPVAESSAAVAMGFEITPASTGRPPRLGRRHRKVGLH